MRIIHRCFVLSCVFVLLLHKKKIKYTSVLFCLAWPPLLLHLFIYFYLFICSLSGYSHTAATAPSPPHPLPPPAGAVVGDGVRYMGGGGGGGGADGGAAGDGGGGGGGGLKLSVFVDGKAVQNLKEYSMC
jgi:uncharacterized membrane protein YgcG